MNSRTCHGNGSRNSWCGRLAGVVLGACLLAAAGGAEAYQQVSATEGSGISIRYSLPSFPHEARRYHTGYSGVRYKLYTRDGTAEGQPWVIVGNQVVHDDTDYFSVDGIPWTLDNNNNFSKTLVLTYNTVDDDRAEGDEYFWLYLRNPEVKRPGSDNWESHGGSHHVPLEITFQMIIRDND